MKKALLSASVLALLLGLGVTSHAGLPQDQGAQLSGSYSHSQIAGSSTTAIASSNISVAVAPATASNSGGQSVSYRNCFTKFLVQLSTQASFTVFDGPAVSSNAIIGPIYGGYLGAAPGNTISLPEDHLGPVCTTAGNTTTITISTNAFVVNNAVTNLPGGVSYEGYTTAGPGSSAN